MNKSFLDILAKAITEAERQNCSPKEFLAGLEEMLAALQERVSIEKSIQG